MYAAAGLNACLFVCRDDEFIGLQISALPTASVQIEYATGLAGKLWIAWKNPAAVVPGPNGVLMKPAPDRAVGDCGDQARLENLSGDVRRTPMGERKAVSGGQLTGERFDLNGEFWGGKSGGDPDETALPDLPAALRRNVCATC